MTDKIENLTDEELDTVAGGLRYNLDSTFIKNWSNSGYADDHPTEEIAFYDNKVAHSY